MGWNHQLDNISPTGPEGCRVSWDLQSTPAGLMPTVDVELPDVEVEVFGQWMD